MYEEETSHSLEDLNQKITPLNMEDLIEKIRSRNNLAGEKTRVMEIGTGNGRVLMELQKKFPDIEFYGVNKDKTHTFYRRESFILTALKFNIFTKEELEKIELPYLVFENLDFGHKIPYDDNKFDLIFSQNTLRYIRFKFELMDEILRVLRPGGISLHTDISGLNIYEKGVVVSLRDAFVEMRRLGINVRVLENPKTMWFEKSLDKNLKFPVAPHTPIPSDTQNLSSELKKPEMGYSLIQ